MLIAVNIYQCNTENSYLWYSKTYKTTYCSHRAMVIHSNIQLILTHTNYVLAADEFSSCHLIAQTQLHIWRYINMMTGDDNDNYYFFGPPAQSLKVWILKLSKCKWLQRRFIRWWWCSGRRPHFPREEPWTGAETRMLFPWCHLWYCYVIMAQSLWELTQFIW